MRISEAKECIKELYRTTSNVTALISERGVGKTSAYQQCAKEMVIDYIALYAAALEGPDFMGLPAKNLETGLTHYLAPQFLPTQAAIDAGLYKESGILVLEEINRVPSDTISVLYPLLLEHKINGHELGKGWRIGVTMNPDTMSYLVNALDDAILDRFISIQIDANIEDYIAFSREHELNEQVIGFLKEFPDLLLQSHQDNALSSKSKMPTPRGWSKVQEIMNKTSLPNHLLHELLIGIIGPIAASSFIGYIGKSSIKTPSAKNILVDYKTEQAAVQELVQSHQTSILTKVIERVIGLLEEDSDMVEMVDRFLRDLPDEMKVYFYKALNREKETIFDYYNDHSLVFEEIGDLIIDRMAM